MKSMIILSGQMHKNGKVAVQDKTWQDVILTCML